MLLNDLEKKANFKLQESYYNQRRVVTNLYAKAFLITNNSKMKPMFS
jgi:hypothetical protein